MKNLVGVAVGAVVLALSGTSLAADVAEAKVPAAPHATESLEALGLPSEGLFGLKHDCYGYKVLKAGAIKLGDRSYLHGFQVSSTNCVLQVGPWTWGWHIAGLYRAFNAYVGLGAGETQPAVLSFPGPKGDPMTFVADGHSVKQVTLIAGLPTKIHMNVAGTLNLVVETTTMGATIDFAEDMLTA